MKRRSFFALLLAGLMLLSAMTACGKQEPNQPDGTDSSGTTNTPPIDSPTAPERTPEEYSRLIDQAFNGVTVCEETAFSFWETDQGAVISGYNGERTALRIPERIANLPVVGIAENAFADQTRLRTLILPDTVTSVGKGMIRGCTALTALYTPILGANADSDNYLGYLFGADSYRNNAVQVPVSLQILSFGSGMNQLDDFALFECNDLLLIRLSPNIKKLGRFSLYGCSRLKSISLDAITELADHALSGCSSLQEISFGSAVTRIGMGALENCTALLQITLPFVGETQEENRFFGYLFGAETADHNRFLVPRNLHTVTLLPGCTALGNNAFLQCEGLRTITLPPGLSSIGIRAFSGCTALQSIALPRGLTHIGDNAFFGCASLSSVTFEEGLLSLGINTFYHCSSLTRVTLPQSITKIPASCFADCSALAWVDLGGAVSVGKNAFYRCNALASAKAPEGVKMEAGNDSLLALLSPKE